MAKDKDKNAAKQLLADEETCASACAAAIQRLLEESWLLWEPETLWLELHAQGVDVPVGNRAQIMAARNLLTTGRFFYDAHAYAATAIAFNNEEPLHVGIEEAPVAYLNWTVYEAQEIVRTFSETAALGAIYDFDREPLCYTAVQLEREGFVVAPHHLSFADAELKKRLPNQGREHQDLILLVREGWATAPRGGAIKDVAFPETPAGVQLARLAAVQLYFDKRMATRERQLQALGGV